MNPTEQLAQRFSAVMPNYLKPLYEHPISIDHGVGSYVWDAEGRQYLDFFGGILTTMIGHANPAVTAAIQAQASKVMHTTTLYLNEEMIAFAEEVARVSGVPDPRVFLTPSGSEANDTAILLATNYRRSNQVLAMRNSYHGRSLTTQAITSHSSWLTSSYSGLDVQFVQGPYRLRSPFAGLGDDDYIEACVGDLIQVMDMRDANGFACLIFEPIQGVGGFATPPDGFFGAMGKVLSSHDVLLISDEVQTGWGRTGEHFWGYEAHGVVPDMITFAKGCGNGITLAGIVARADIMNCLNATTFTTFGGNPLSAAAGRATLHEVLNNDLQANALARGSEMRERLEAAVAASPHVAEVRGKGLMQALEFVHPDSIEPDAATTLRYMEACKDAGLLVGKGGLYGNVVRIAPMLNVTEAEMDEGVGTLVDCLAEVAA